MLHFSQQLIPVYMGIVIFARVKNDSFYSPQLTMTARSKTSMLIHK